MGHCLRTPLRQHIVHAAGWCEADGCPSSIGWEVGPVPGRLGPRAADLASSMDPRALAQSAVNLNLGLMRWRAAPSLDLERLSGTRCLLLGAGMPPASQPLSRLDAAVRSSWPASYASVHQFCISESCLHLRSVFSLFSNHLCLSLSPQVPRMKYHLLCLRRPTCQRTPALPRQGSSPQVDLAWDLCRGSQGS